MESVKCETQDDELQKAVPAVCKSAQPCPNYCITYPENPFYLLRSDNLPDEIIFGAPVSDPPKRSIPQSQIFGSPDLALHKKKRAGAKTGNPMLTMLSNGWSREEIKSEVPGKHMSQRSLISLPPGTPKSSYTNDSKKMTLNKSIDTTISISKLSQDNCNYPTSHSGKKGPSIDKSIPMVSSSLIGGQLNPEICTAENNDRVGYCKLCKKEAKIYRCCLII